MDGLFSILAALIIFICLLKGVHANYKDKVAKGLIPKDEDEVSEEETKNLASYVCGATGSYPSSPGKNLESWIIGEEK